MFIQYCLKIGLPQSKKRVFSSKVSDFIRRDNKPSERTTGRSVSIPAAAANLSPCKQLHEAQAPRADNRDLRVKYDTANEF